MILEIFVAIFVVIFTTMMATSSTGGYESDLEKYSKLKRKIEDMEKKGNGGGLLKKVQADGVEAEEYYESFGLNMGTNDSSGKGKPKNNGPFGGDSLLGEFAELGLPLIGGKGKKSGGKYEELKPCRDGVDGINGIDGIGEKGDKGEPGLGGGKGGGVDDVAEYLKKGGLYIDFRNMFAGQNAGANSDGSKITGAGVIDKSTFGSLIEDDYDESLVKGNKIDIKASYDVFCKDRKENPTLDDFAEKYHNQLEHTLEKYGQTAAKIYLAAESVKEGSGKDYLAMFDILKKKHA